MEAIDKLTERISVLETSSSRLLRKILTVSLPFLQAWPCKSNGRLPLCRALSVAYILADLQVDAEFISAAILREVTEAGAMTVDEVKKVIDTGVGDLLFEWSRVKNISSKVKNLDDNSKMALRKFCLTYYDIRAIILELAFKLDMMRHLYCLPTLSRQMLSYDVINIYAPLAHAVDTETLSVELEDLAFRYLFPCSYLYVDTWLRWHETGSALLIDLFKKNLLKSLKSDSSLQKMVDDISIHGRYKSRSSAMQKLFKDVPRPQEVNDLVGLRVILNPRSGDGEEACYRTRDVIRDLFREVPERAMDYIARPNANGYKSLHMVIDINDSGTAIPLTEIQIRTTEMHRIADGGHSLYKGGLTDPKEMGRLKSIVRDALDQVPLHLRDLPSPTLAEVIENARRNGEFHIPDKNQVGRLSMEQLRKVVEKHGVMREDALVLMHLGNAIGDNSLRFDQSDLFQEQVYIMDIPHVKDEEYENLLPEKLRGSYGLIPMYWKVVRD